MRYMLTTLFIAFPLIAHAQSKGNRLAYLDELDPYYPNKDFPKLITPQWVGEKGVDAVVILGIDDMRDTKRYEKYLRPILNRLKKIDGRAALSIMACKVDPKDPQLQKWLKEGVSIETHTYDHPCPIFKKGFKFAKETYDKCVDLMFEIPNNKPVAFRMPCCDSLNTPSPRFWAEIFNTVTPANPQATKGGNFLSIDTSVFNVFTSADKELPRELVLENGRERFRKYAPKDRHFVNYVENYPYPYVIGRLCWEFPCVTPSDWSAQHYHGKNNAITIKDWQRALDCTVVKKGVFCLVFHPHGWIRNDQIVQLIDYAQEKYGKRVKFLNFREALERLERNLGGKNAFQLRSQSQILDLNDDGYMDIVTANREPPKDPHITEIVPPTTKIWVPVSTQWKSFPYPQLFSSPKNYGVFANRQPGFLIDGIANVMGGFPKRSFHYYCTLNSNKWIYKETSKNVVLNWHVPYLRDINSDGICEIVSFGRVFAWDKQRKTWKNLAFKMPYGPPEFGQRPLLDKDDRFRPQQNDRSVFFLDLNNDNKLDIIFSNEKSYGVYLFTDMKRGWSKKIIAGKQGDKNAIPPIVRNGTNNGFFVHGRSLYWANEDTAPLKDHVRRITFDELLNKASRRRKPSEKPARQSRETVPSQAEPGTEDSAEPPCNCCSASNPPPPQYAESVTSLSPGSHDAHPGMRPATGVAESAIVKPPCNCCSASNPPPPQYAESASNPPPPQYAESVTSLSPGSQDAHPGMRPTTGVAATGFATAVNHPRNPDGVRPSPPTQGAPAATLGWGMQRFQRKYQLHTTPAQGAPAATLGWGIQRFQRKYQLHPTTTQGAPAATLGWGMQRFQRKYQLHATATQGAPAATLGWGIQRFQRKYQLHPTTTQGAPAATLGWGMQRFQRKYNSREQPHNLPGPKSPADSLKCIKARPGFTVELVAAEPLVKDPIAINWGINDGKLWVVEMGDYPNGIDGKPGGRVKFLTDTNKDGKYDKATIFLDKLPFPTGVTPWKKGVLITAAPDIIYAEDTTGDGKADVRKVLYTGFGEGNQQHRVNGLWWGLDGWLYGANGDSGGVVKSIKTGKSVNISGRDFRIKPDEGLIEPVTGQTQFGRCRDDWGNWFGCNNSFPLFHFVLPDRYLRRNPHVKYPPAKINIIPRNDRIYPISKPLPRFNDHHTLNKFTSACSAMIYRDDFFGPEFYGNAFIAEPVHNLISRRILTPNGITFTAKRAKGEEKSEFLASTDNWFRPTMVRMGPDGALWIADMYRLVIEHPKWIPKDWQAKLDLRSGHDRGRIYRVVPVGKKVAMKPTSDFLDGLISRNGIIRDAALNLYRPKSLSDSFWPLEIIIGAIDYDRLLPVQAHADILHAFRFSAGADTFFGKQVDSSNFFIRRAAVAAAERLYKVEPALGKMIIALAKDKNPMVRIQLAFSIGSMGKIGAKNLAQMALREHDNPYIFAAILSSISKDNIDSVFQEVITAAKGDVPRKVVQQLLHLNQAYGRTRNIAQLLQALTKKGKNGYTAGQMSVVAEWFDSISDKQLQNILLNSELELKAAARQLKYFVASARDVLSDGKSSASAKRQAIRLLGRGILKVDEEIEVLAGFLKPTVGPVLQEAAVESLARSANPQAVVTMFSAWKQLLPARRSQVVGVVLQNSDGPDLILDQLAKKRIAPSEIDAVFRQRLLEHRSAKIKNRAKKLFQTAGNEDREKLLARYQPALKAKGDPKIGMKIFEKTCAACHRLHNIGTEVGPDLGALTDKSKEALLTAILHPNQAVEAKFQNYAVFTKAGKSLSGLITEETGTSITLVEANGKKQVLLRKDIAQLGSTGKSAMPEGLERDISVEEMPHLLAFVRGK